MLVSKNERSLPRRQDLYLISLYHVFLARKLPEKSKTASATTLIRHRNSVFARDHHMLKNTRSWGLSMYVSTYKQHLRQDEDEWSKGAGEIRYLLWRELIGGRPASIFQPCDRPPTMVWARPSWLARVYSNALIRRNTINFDFLCMIHGVRLYIAHQPYHRMSGCGEGRDQPQNSGSNQV